MLNGDDEPVRELRVGEATARVYIDRRSMGEAAAKAVKEKVVEIVARKDGVSMVFASAPSQEEFLVALAKMDGIEWPKVVAFHLDEYIDLPGDAPQAFGRFLRDRLFSKVKIGKVHYLDGKALDLEKEAERYAGLLKEHSLDIACIGIGENGHIAFNDPHVADFNDPLMVKVVELEEVSRQQQVNDGCFANIDDVPRRALTLTIPVIFDADHVFVIVPARSKAEAVRRTVHGPICEECPASILRKHASTTMFLDQDSAVFV